MTGVHPLAYPFRRLGLLVRADLKVLFNSPWFYLILVMSVLIVTSFTLIQPRDDLSVLYLIDELDNPVSREIANRLSQEGYKVERIEASPDQARARFDWACQRMRRDLAFAVIHVTRTHEVRCRVFSYMAEDVIRYTLEKILERYRFEAYQRQMVARGGAWPELDALARPFLETVGEGPDQVAVIIVSGIWYLCGITTLILWILSKDGFAKLMRIYSFLEILLAKTVAGTVLGIVLAVTFFTTAIVLGIRFESTSGLLVSALWSVVTGVLSGLLLGALALSLGGSIFSLMMIGLLGITLLFLLLTIISGMFVPLGGLAGWVNVLGRWMPLFAQIEILRWTALSGGSLADPLSLHLMASLALINAGQFGLSLLFLKRL